MDKTLAGEELAWLRALCRAKEKSEAAPSLPPEVAFRLRLRGYVAANAHGAYAITIRGRYELIEHERGRAVEMALRAVPDAAGDRGTGPSPDR